MPDGLTDLLVQFHQSNLLRLAIPFCAFTVLLVLARGPNALRLSDETLRSVTVTLAILLINGHLAAYLVLSIDLSAGGYELIGLPHISTAVWDRLPWPVVVMIVLFLIDLADYWTHRLMHNSILWGVHAVHHSEQRMTWLTSSRVHLFESSIMKLGYVMLLGWIGMPLWSLLAANTVAYLHNRYVHCGLEWNHGPLAKVIASPNWHRWHHAIDPAAYNKNYANVFSVIDVMFGTYHNPGTCQGPTGLAEMPNPGVVNQMLYPFTYGAERVTALRRRVTPEQP